MESGTLRARAALTLLETAVVTSLATGLTALVLFVQGGTSTTFAAHEQLHELRATGRRALERIAKDVRRAITTRLPGPDGIPGNGDDVEQLFVADKPGGLKVNPSTTEGPCLELREAVDPNGDGRPDADDGATTWKVWIAGPDHPTAPGDATPPAFARGIVRLRALQAADLATASGQDGLFGTLDDRTQQLAADGRPLVELLVPSTYAPRTPPMLKLARAGRTITVTLALNARKRRLSKSQEDPWVLPQDLTLCARVALLQ